MNNKTLYILGVIIIAGFAILGVLEMQQLKTPYITTKSGLIENERRTIQFMGEIVREDSKYDDKIDTLYFSIKGDDNNTIPVSYKGTIPANFDTSENAVVRGKYNGNMIIADNILLKCPSKYEGKSK
ncbi:MAG: cytochrome c maturation protein CcmE [Armatimonadota bacterium]